ncbi:sporulation protein YpjB [Paenibacillus thalictri]|nr:sporulation protein YpjB [Paenibacillus thalictri]
MFVSGKGKRLFLTGLMLLVLLSGCGQRIEQKEQDAVKIKAQSGKMERLDQLAEEMFNKVVKGDMAGGRELLDQMSDQIAQIDFSGMTSVEGLHAFTETVTQAKRSFNSVQAVPDEGRTAAAKVRLAVDALKSPHDPMWHQYYKVLQTDTDGLEKAAKEANKGDLQRFAGQLDSHYGIVRTPIVMSRTPAEVEKMDSLIVFVKSQMTAQAPFQPVLSVVPHIRQTLDELFMKKEKPAYLPIVDDEKPIIWSIGIASFIVAAMVYAAWRMLQKDQGVRAVKRKDEHAG